jgi:pimeloyl-ACP methyl ester carboxylesterase
METMNKRNAVAGQAAAPVVGHYAGVNGLHLYYEVYGAGEPLILLHGGFGTTAMFGENLPRLAAGRQVIAVELQGHGHTADIDRPLRYESMGDDIAALIQHLGLGRADVMGFSLGGGVALQCVIRHPEVVRKAALVSTVYSRSGWLREHREGMAAMGAETAEFMRQTPLYTLYEAAAPRPQDWVRLNIKMGDLLRQEYDWSEAIPAIQTPVMLVVGDADGIHPSHYARFYELLGGGARDAGWDGSGMSVARLAVLPWLTHYNINVAPQLAETVIPFLDAPMPA